MQQLVERTRVHAQHRLLAAEETFLRHVDGDADCGLGGALPEPRLQHPEPPVVDRELDVLHVAVVRLEARAHGFQLGKGLRHQRLERGRRRAAFTRAASVSGCGVRMPATTSSPWALIRNSP